MKALILVAKASISFVWLVLFANIFYPFPGNAAITLYILTGFLFMMHGIQMLIFIGAFGDKIAATRWEKWSILIFGIFAMLDIRRKYMS
ncbi:DUF1145 domain-containing protein [Veronia pacifica]|uniref:DUF1145 domain-containing protein n=1 Tax=Veronia pacifica TaxID=1080227 RepID=A0A1C3EJ49_9GAMM|nr:DUF1145 domain-containing protein [Veronia pacifica]ODA33253.1 hypothetical protein A8L45_10635 [Veronia pacifica]